MKRAPLLLGFVLLLVNACASVGGTTCRRADECNNLSGVSVNECIDNVNRALSNLTSGQRADCENALAECEKLDACTSFTSCAKSIKYCPGVPYLHGK